MDTRFWGPSGWRILHSITFSYNPIKDKSAVRELFTMLPYVLPCKFCRTSLQEYMEADPLEPTLVSRDSLTRWLWRIHNSVNAKLRDQKLPVEPDPPFESVKEFYDSLLASGCSKTEFSGWDFLFSVADLHPMSPLAKKSVPMPGAPPCDSLKTLEEKNKWNCLRPEERLPLYKKFWVAVGKSLPFNEWREIWKNIPTSTHTSKTITMKWLWKVRCQMEDRLDLLNRCKYSQLCKTLKSHRSGCSKSRRARTCRKTKTKTIKQR